MAGAGGLKLCGEVRPQRRFGCGAGSLPRERCFVRYALIVMGCRECGGLYETIMFIMNVV